MYRESHQKTKLVDNGECPLCDSPAYSESDHTHKTLIICRRCGKFVYDYMGLVYLSELRSDKRRYKISHVMRTVSERAFGKRDNTFFPTYLPTDFTEMLERPEPTVQEKLGLLLRYLASQSEYPGFIGEFDCGYDYPVLGAKSPSEGIFCLRALEEQGLLSPNLRVASDLLQKFTLSAAAWTELDRVAKLGSESAIAFIAMWFDPTMAEIDQAIDEAVRNSGYEPIRIDRVEHLNRIDDEILARIRQSKFLIADFTGQRNGVYFEAGFMLGLGRPVIWLCKKDHLANVHFDTRQYNTIDYVDPEDLKKRLQFRIEANLGAGPHAVPK